MEHIKKAIERAVASNDVDSIRDLFESNEDIHTLASSERVDILNRSLSQSVKAGHLNIVKLLLTLGADVNCEDPIKQSVLHQTAFNHGSNIEEIILVLIRNGANINHQQANGETCFMRLVASGVLAYKHLIDLVDSVQNVHEKNLVTGGSYLHMLKERDFDEDRVELISKFLKRGVPINGKDYNDDTPLHLMASVACCYSMRFLIEHGANINARNRFGETVLHSLASSNEYIGFSESLQFLFEKGVDINDRDNLGRTVIHHALFSKQTTPDAIKEFTKYGIKINVSDSDGKNEIFHAVEDVVHQADYSIDDLNIRADVITLLARVGGDINKGDNLGITPLHQATKTYSAAIISALMDCDADITKKTQTGATPLHWSCKRNSIARIVIDRYVRNNCDINIKDNFGSTPLHWAVWYREISVAHTLVQNGCDVNITDKGVVSHVDLANKVHFNKFFDLITSSEKIDLENIKNAVNTCSEEYTFYACPYLKFIVKSNDHLIMDVYVDHLILHQTAIRKCIDTALNLENMGLYFDIKDNVDIPKLFKMLMYSLAESVSKRNELLKCDLELRGSSMEGTKVGLPDEFDYLWNLCEFSKSFVPVESVTFPSGFIKLRLNSEAVRDRFSEYLTHDNFLDCRLLTRHLYTLLNEELRKILHVSNVSMFSNIICTKFLNEICFSVATFQFDYTGQVAKDLNISVDIVPNVCLGQWMPCGQSAVVIKHLKKENENLMFSAVFKTPNMYNTKDFFLFYRISYAQLEQSVFKTAPVVIKKAYIVLKILIDSGYVPMVVDYDLGTYSKQYISSYLLKTCLLHVLERFKNENSKKSSNFSTYKSCYGTAIGCARMAIDYFEECIEKRHLPVYFDPSKNLLSLEGISVVGSTDLGVLKQLTSLMKLLLDLYEEDGCQFQN